MLFCRSLFTKLQLDRYSSDDAKLVIFSEIDKKFGGYFLIVVPLQQKTYTNQCMAPTLQQDNGKNERTRKETRRDRKENYFHDVKINFQSVKIYFHDVKIDFQTLKIVL